MVDNYEQLSHRAANIVASQIILKPNSVIGLATGGTPLGMYQELVKMYIEEDLDFTEVKTFNLDEYYPIKPDNEESYHYYMMENLFKHVDINPANIHIPNGMAKDVQKECERYEELIKKWGGLDLQVLGIGRNGHIGFNEPNPKFEAVTHLVELDEDTIIANSRFFPSAEEVPKQAISMGIKTIMHSRKILLLANGEEKVNVIKEALEGPIMPELPASILQLHPDVTVIIDRDAAKYLTHRKIR